MTAAPHDALFKATFSRVEQAVEELRHVLPSALVARMDLTSLSVEAGSFVDEALRERHTDLLYLLRLDGRDARIYVLFEHQSSGDPWMPLRLLRYMLRIWESCIVGGATVLPIVIPVVLHHSDVGWQAPASFQALFELPAEAVEFTPHFRFALDDLGAQSEAQLRARAASAFTRMVLSALQQSRSGQDLGELLRGWHGLIRELLQAPDGKRALRLVFRSLFEVRGAAEFAAIDTTASEIGTESEDVMETIAQMLESRGLQRGLQQGRQEGQRALLLRLLRRRFGELPVDAVARVDAAQGPELERWAEQLLLAGSLDEVFLAP